jgi:hypothetical protein
MAWVAVAVVGSSLISGAMQADAAGDAADSQAQSSAASIAEQRRQFDLTRSDSAPYRSAGGRALGTLEKDINTPVSSADVMSDPGYQFGLKQGQIGLDRKAAAAGGRVSGAALKSAAEYATNYASTGYNAAYQRRQDRLNRLASLAGIGQSATAASSQAGASSANAISGILSSQGDAAGAARLAQGNIWGNSINQIGAAAQKWAGGQQGAQYGRDQYGTAFTNEDIMYN